MAVLRQKTIQLRGEKQRIVLKKLSNTFDMGGQYMYTIEDKDTGERIEDPIFNKSDAMDEFEATARQIGKGMKSKGSTGPSIPGLGGGGGGFGPSGGDDDIFSW